VFLAIDSWVVYRLQTRDSQGGREANAGEIEIEIGLWLRVWAAPFDHEGSQFDHRVTI